MPEPPDFLQLAWRLKYFIDDQPQLSEQNAQAIANTLKDVWNTRGAADAHAVEEKLATLTGWVSSEPYRQHLREAITGLDR